MNHVIEARWYESPERWVDALDIQEQGKHSIVLLKDLIVNRVTEYSQFKQLFLRALQRPMTLLPRQQTAIMLADEALELGVTVSAYISEQLDISPQASRRLLHRAEARQMIISYQEIAKMFPFDSSIPIYSEGQQKIELDASETKRLKAGLRVPCPAKPYNFDDCAGTASAKYGLCYSCANIFGKTQAERPEWLQFLIQDNDNQLYQDAKDQQFDSKYGANVDVSDIYT